MVDDDEDDNDEEDDVFVNPENTNKCFFIPGILVIYITSRRVNTWSMKSDMLTTEEHAYSDKIRQDDVRHNVNV